MASVWKRNRYWYITYADRSGKRITTSSHMTEKKYAVELASRLEAQEILARRTGPDPADQRIADNHHTPLATLLEQWKASIIGRGNTTKHADEQHMQASYLIEVAQVQAIGDLMPSAVSIALGKLRDQEQLGLNTLNHYLRAIKAFSRWLWTDGRTRIDPLAALRGYRAKTDRRLVRRPLTIDEIRRLYQAADFGPPVLGFSGPDRGMLYRLMLGTGFRVGEVRSLRVRNILWREKPIQIVVEAAFSKHRREDRQPIRFELADKLRAYIRNKGLAGDAVIFPLPDKPNRMLQHDLLAADPPIPVCDQQNRWIDMHSLRHTFITECARHFPPKIAQQLARHQSITQTMDLYAHVEPQAAGEMLQSSPFYDGKTHPKAAGGGTEPR